MRLKIEVAEPSEREIRRSLSSATMLRYGLTIHDLESMANGETIFVGETAFQFVDEDSEREA